MLSEANDIKDFLSRGDATAGGILRILCGGGEGERAGVGGGASILSSGGERECSSRLLRMELVDFDFEDDFLDFLGRTHYIEMLVNSSKMASLRVATLYRGVSVHKTTEMKVYRRI